MTVQRSVAPVADARALLDGLRGARLSESELVATTRRLAELLQNASDADRTREEAQRAQQLAALMADENGPAFTTLLTDRAFRSTDPARVVDAARHLLRRLGVPHFAPWLDRVQMGALLRLGPFVPSMAARGLLARVERDSRHVVLSSEPSALARYLAGRRIEGVRVNLNHLGEAVLGEVEAERRVKDYVELLARPEVEAISVKTSAIFSQADVLAWEDTLDTLSERLQAIYATALAHRYVRPDGSAAPKLVTLDMESYRDLRLTLAVFQRALSADALRGVTAGVVLQAYLPESFPLQRELTLWAQLRVQRGGAPIRLRIVKGANLLTERAESALRGWPLPIYANKAEVDASYKRMVEHGCQAERSAAVKLGLASHNVFDLAFGMVMRAASGVEADVGFELLEGMAPSLQRVISEVTGDALVYAPLVDQGGMQTAIAYLMRRLDENTADENFLRHSFAMQAGDEAWQAQAARFEQAVARRRGLSHAALRTQNRRVESADLEAAIRDGRAAGAASAFANEADTDFSLAENRAWIAEQLTRAQETTIDDVRSVIAGEPVEGGAAQDGFDPSRPSVVPYRWLGASAQDIERALAAAVAAAPRWASRSLEERGDLLRAVAAGLRARRGALIAAMVLDAGKRVDQADTEVSEAIDFAQYYPASFAERVAELPELTLAPRGIVLVTPPWNFPLAIPAGGVLAALAAGNVVILKPALETVLVAARLCEVCWDAGIPRDALQLVICEDEVGSQLVRDPRVGVVVLTGATETARLFQRLRPGLRLCAETGGKNAIVVSALADRDEAIRDVLASAFGHAGQKCSACSLLVLEAEVHDDPHFLATLADAASSLPVGSAWEPASVVTPLIRPARDALLLGLTTLERGESWLLAPRRDAENPRLWSPGIKLGVREGSFCHVTELFGPVLSVLRADDLEHALRIANATPYGLTAGLFSLDEREQELWQMRMRAGNLYVNRPITGAIVRRQPFGGLKGSSVGTGAKAGGPNYALQLTQATQREPPAVAGPPTPAAAALLAAVRRHLEPPARERLSTAACSYGHAQRTCFALDHDPSRVLGERNVLRYLPCAPLLLRAASDVDPLQVLLAVTAAVTADASFVLSLHPALAERVPVLRSLPNVSVAVDDESALITRITPELDRIRALGAVEEPLARAAEEALVHVADGPPFLSGRLELLAYHREQAICHRYHRYGNLAPERLLPPLRTEKRED